MKLLLQQNTPKGDNMIALYMNYIMHCFTERKFQNGKELTVIDEEYLLKSLEVSGELLSE